MPNWCSNVLLAAGEPENVAEFLILNAQHTNFGDEFNKPKNCLKKNLSNDIKSFLSDITNHLVGERKSADISFGAFNEYLGGPAHKNWGTKWDVVNEVYNLNLDRGAWKTSEHVPTFGRLEQWGMSTAWGPPNKWLDHVSQIFPSVSLCIGHEESGNGVFGIITVRSGHCCEERLEPSSRSAPKIMDMAISQGRKSMPLHRKPNALLRAIWEDNDTLVKLALSKTSVDGVFEGIKSRWSPLMHAAFSGSEKVARALISAGADPLFRVNLGKGHSFGMNDICLDLNADQHEVLVQSRQSIFLMAMEKKKEFSRQPLGSGCDSLTLAMRYQMGPLIVALLPVCPLVTVDKNGRNNGCAESLVSGFSFESVKKLIDLVPSQQIFEFSNQLITSLIESNTPGLMNNASTDKPIMATAGFLMELYDRGLMHEDQFKMICKEIPVKISENGVALMVGVELSCVIASERAKRAIDEVLGLQRIPSP